MTGVSSDFIYGKAGALHVRRMDAKTTSSRGDILFIHGAWSSSWYWEPFFIPFFADAGFNCAAVSLRGHGQSEGKIKTARIQQYVDDVYSVAKTLNDPIIVGHSMGGFVAQHYARKHKTGKLVLLASVPSSGAWRAFLNTARDYPSKLLRCIAKFNLHPVVEDPEIARHLLFSRDKARTDKDHFLEKLNSESFLAFLDMMTKPILSTKQPAEKNLVIGAELDRIISMRSVAKTAKTYGVKPVIMPLTSHMLMIDNRWSEAAELILKWLDEDQPSPG